ncbi:hypothetical protein CSKR_108285 [Clonorchis sinensis]|uniref:Uncharacterized protein n=1 Tax=Clonorchis sinensis TaxID=79923 RepID=A0A3R7GKJ5_CLOSI|nr:hypothetical protein CSKR_108285 [Clonorchis sinensis]
MTRWCLFSLLIMRELLTLVAVPTVTHLTIPSQKSDIFGLPNILSSGLLSSQTKGVIPSHWDTQNLISSFPTVVSDNPVTSVTTLPGNMATNVGLDDGLVQTPILDTATRSSGLFQPNLLTNLPSISTLPSTTTLDTTLPAVSNIITHPRVTDLVTPNSFAIGALDTPVSTLPVINPFGTAVRSGAIETPGSIQTDSVISPKITVNTVRTINLPNVVDSSTVPLWRPRSRVLIYVVPKVKYIPHKKMKKFVLRKKRLLHKYAEEPTDDLYDGMRKTYYDPYIGWPDDFGGPYRIPPRPPRWKGFGMRHHRFHGRHGPVFPREVF